MFADISSVRCTIARSIGAIMKLDRDRDHELHERRRSRPARSPTSAPSPGVIGVGLVLLQQIGGDHAAADDPQAAAEVAERR